MGKNNLDDLKLKKEKILPDDIQVSHLEEKPVAGKKKVKELNSETVSFKITKREMAVLKERAGELVSPGRFIKHYLKTKTDLLIDSKGNG